MSEMDVCREARTQEAETGKNDGSNMPMEHSPSPQTAASIEAAEEAKLRSKFPMAGRPMAGHSAFLQKRLAKGGAAPKYS